MSSLSFDLRIHRGILRLWMAGVTLFGAHVRELTAWRQPSADQAEQHHLIDVQLALDAEFLDARATKKIHTLIALPSLRSLAMA